MKRYARSALSGALLLAASGWFGAVLPKEARAETATLEAMFAAPPVPAARECKLKFSIRFVKCKSTVTDTSTKPPTVTDEFGEYPYPEGADAAAICRQQGINIRNRLDNGKPGSSKPRYTIDNFVDSVITRHYELKLPCWLYDLLNGIGFACAPTGNLADAASDVYACSAAIDDAVGSLSDEELADAEPELVSEEVETWNLYVGSDSGPSSSPTTYPSVSTSTFAR